MNSGLEIIGIILCVYLVSVLIGTYMFPCPFGRTKEEGWWDKEKTRPKIWNYHPTLGGYGGLPGYWKLRAPYPKDIKYEFKS